MEITRMQTRAFWKGEVGVDGQVKDCGRVYQVRLDIKGSHINGCSCSCSQGNSYRNMCPHEKALYESYQKQETLNSEQPISTSSQARAMIREYTNKEVAEIMKQGQENSIRLLPRLIIGQQDVRAEFRIGREKFYIIKDLTAFAKAIRQGTYVEYGKNLAFCHSTQAFSQGSRNLLELVLELTDSYNESYEQFRKSTFDSMPSLRELKLNRHSRDRFLNLLAGKELEIQDSRGEKRQIQVIYGNPKTTVLVKKAGKKGLEVSLDKKICSFCGEQHLYVLDGSKLFICDQAFSKEGEIFFRQMTQGYGAPYKVTISERDVPLFYERVLSRFQKYGNLETGQLNLEEMHSLKLKARFELESPKPGQVILHPTLSYGDFSFHPVEDEKIPGTICRDIPGEFRISQVLSKYFKYRDPKTNDLMLQDDEEALFLLLTEGVEELRNLGEVWFAQEMNDFKVLTLPKVSVGVRMAGQWLELALDIGDMAGTDWMKILEAYRQKKKYCRLKNGEFLKLEESGLSAVIQIADGLSLPKKELEKQKIRIPRYRALYLDQLCEERNDIQFTKNEMYQAIVRGMRDGKDSKPQIPPAFSQVLRDYQKVGFQWLKTLDTWGFGGILADDMGLGKTVQIISVLYDKAEKKYGEEKKKKDISLVICPASLVYNWECEIQTFAPSLQILVVTGNSVEREDQLKTIGEFDVVITSYDLLKRDLPFYEPYTFRFQIIDEAQYIKNPDTQSAKAVKSIHSITRFALTGTPVENRLSELWSIFDYLMPGFLFTYPRFKKEYEIPVVKEENTIILKRLQKMTAPFILRRLKKDVLKELPEKLETVVYSRMEQKQKELYTANLWNLKQQVLEGSQFQILSGLTRIRQVCCDPRLIYDNYQGGSAKLETCMELIKSGVASGHKILLFSQFTSMLDLIGQRMTGEGLQFHMLTGKIQKEKRLQTVNAFYEDDVPVFLISLKAGGTGLNLTAADMVIHYDPWWNVAAQNQATDRTYRIGQKKQVSVFQLITKDTIEENILKLQKSKQVLAEQVIQEGCVSLGRLSQEQLLRLLE